MTLLRVRTDSLCSNISQVIRVYELTVLILFGARKAEGRVKFWCLFFRGLTMDKASILLYCGC